MLGCKRKEKKNQNLRGKRIEERKERQSRRKINPQHSVNTADVRKA